MKSQPGLTWDDADNTQARLAVLHAQHEHLTERFEEHVTDERTWRTSLDGKVDTLLALARDRETTRKLLVSAGKLGAAMVATAATLVALIGGVVAIIRHWR